MPTTLPAVPLAPRPVPRLSAGQTVRFFYLLARSRWLLRRLNAAHARRDREGTDTASRTLFEAAHRWLDCHEEIGGMLGLPPPPHVVQMRAVLRFTEPRRT